MLLRLRWPAVMEVGLQLEISDIYINSMGTVLPELVSAPESDDESMTGAAVAGDTPMAELALTATRQALERWPQGNSQLALLLSAEVNHSGPDGWLQHSYLQLHAVGGEVLAAGIRQGCNGVFGALALASGYLQTLPRQKAALITSAENHDSSLLDRWTALQGYCMGDGATAVVISRAPGFARLRSVTATTIPELEGLHRGEEPLHPSNVITGRPTSFQERTTAFVAAGKFPMEEAVRLIKTTGDVVARALDEAGIKATDVTKTVTFNGPWSDVAWCLSAMGVPKEQSTWEYGRAIGHSANDHLFAVEHLLREREVGPGDHLLLFGLGPGLNLAAAVIEIVAQPAWLE